MGRMTRGGNSGTEMQRKEVGGDMEEGQDKRRMKDGRKEFGGEWK